MGRAVAVVGTLALLGYLYTLIFGLRSMDSFLSDPIHQMELFSIYYETLRLFSSQLCHW